jgi:hypothetical protein
MPDHAETRRSDLQLLQIYLLKVCLYFDTGFQMFRLRNLLCKDSDCVENGKDLEVKSKLRSLTDIIFFEFSENVAGRHLSL